MSHEKFRYFIQKDDTKNVDEFLENKFLENDRDHPNYNYEDYNIMKDLIRHGKKDMIRKYIEQGFPVNIDIEDMSFDGTPLHVAVLSECAEVVQLLLDNGSCIYKINGNGETPLLLSAIAGIDHVTDLLLSRTEPRECFSSEGLSHFHVACMRNRVDLVQKFLTSGTNIDHTVKRDSQSWPGYTPLHFAVEYRSIETVDFLVKSGADIIIQNEQGSTPLHLAFRKRNKKMIDLLLSTQCFFVHNPQNQEGLSHFHIACAVNNVQIVKDFLQKELFELDHTISYKYHNWPSYDAFRFAIYNDCIKVLENLLKSNNKSLIRRLALLLNDACRKSNREILNLIISHSEKKVVEFQCTSPLGNYFSKKLEPTKIQLKSNGLQKHFKRFEISQQTKLHVAVLHKDNIMVTSILKTHHPSIITIKDKRGKTPLHVAFESNQMEFVQQLLNMHLEINENPADSNSLSHFHIACAKADVNLVEDFVKKEVDIDSTVEMNSPLWAGFTPLHFAIWFHQIDVAILLLNYGANLAAKNASKLSAFDFAIPGFINLFYKSSNLKVCYEEDEDEWEFVEMILSGNSNKKIYEFDNRGISPLHIAAKNNDIHTINRLANPNSINTITDSNLPCWYARLTPLHFAAWFGNEEAVVALLDQGADISLQSFETKTAAHVCPREWLCGKTGRLLLLGPENIYDADGFSLFHLACESNNIEAVKHFLKLNIDINKPIHSKVDYEGQTPLHLAVGADDSEIVKLLLDHGANVDARDRYFCTPISACKSTVVLKILLKNGADPQAVSAFCKTALHHAFFKSKNLNLSVLIEHGWHISEVTENLSIQELHPIGFNKLGLIEYIEKLMDLGVTINENIKSWYDLNKRSVTVGQVASRNLPPKILSFKERCTTESRLMKEVKIDNRTTLYDILFKNSRNLVIYSNNETFQRIIDSEEDLKNKYPIYGCLLMSQFKKGQKRVNLLEQGKTSLSIIANQWMGDLVFETILQFLNDYEIQYLNYATSGKDILDRML